MERVERSAVQVKFMASRVGVLSRRPARAQDPGRTCSGWVWGCSLQLDAQDGGGQGHGLLTWVQVCHAVTVTWGCTVITGHGFPEGFSGARRPISGCLVFPLLPLVQEAGRNILHPLPLTLFIWETGQHMSVLSTSPCPQDVELSFTRA